jgi:hypothetical protein
MTPRQRTAVTAEGSVSLLVMLTQEQQQQQHLLPRRLVGLASLVAVAKMWQQRLRPRRTPVDSRSLAVAVRPRPPPSPLRLLQRSVS